MFITVLCTLFVWGKVITDFQKSKYTHAWLGLVAWRSGSVVRCMNKVVLRWARLVYWDVWRSSDWYTTSVCNQANYVTSALHPSEVHKSSTSLNLLYEVTSAAGWHVTLCDPTVCSPMWYVISSYSSEACLRTAMIRFIGSTYQRRQSPGAPKVQGAPKCHL